MRKLFAVLISAMLIVCYSVVPVSAATLEGTAALTVTPNITEAEAGSSAVEVTYTIRITPPSGKEIGVCAFSLSTPDGVTLQTAEVNDELKYEPSANKTGIFASLSYTKASGYFAAFGTTSDRRLSKTAILMTVKADIASGRTGSYALKIKGFTAGVDGSGDYYSSEVRSEAVTVTEASAGGDNGGTVTPDDSSALIAAIQATKITYPNATSVKAGKVRLTWKKTGSTAVDGFVICRSASKNGKYAKVFTTKTGTVRAYANSVKLKSGRTYWFKVRGFRVVDGVKVWTKTSRADMVKVQ